MTDTGSPAGLLDCALGRADPRLSRLRLRAHTMGTAILLVEQNVSRASTRVQRAYVLESGNVTMHGSSAELADNKHAQAVYLGI
jgi:ABC-type branched-subunit amino acid transport system ATPase component